MKTITFIASLLSLSAFAGDLAKRPKPFNYAEGTAVFADFTGAGYSITYDLEKKEAKVVADIEVVTAEDGNIVFDSLQEPTLVTIDGEETSASLIPTPSKETLVRVVNKIVPAGTHILKIELPLVEALAFTETGVKSAFWMGDLTDRNYIEKYLPTNFVFDRVPMILRLDFKGVTTKQRIYTNGEVFMSTDGSNATVVFPEDFGIECPYFHTVPEGTYPEKKFVIHSIDGRELPAVVYINRDENVDHEEKMTRIMNNTIKIIAELENDYGPFPHASVTVYVNAPSGGMEYSGATITAESALGHELFHSYFARSVLPADGNSGWIDEALARWRDNGYQSIPSLAGTSILAAHDYYTRSTDRMAYTFGERFFALQNYKMGGKLKAFMRHMVETRSFDPITTEDLISEMNDYFGTDVSADFQQYIYGKGTAAPKGMKILDDSEYHHQFTKEDYDRML
jgi:hypothetical protein